MTEPKVTPVGDRILVIPDEKKKKTEGGLYIPDSAPAKVNTGTVHAVGSAAGVKLADGHICSTSLRTGQRVIYESYAGAEIEVAGQTYKALRESEIIAIIG